MLDKSVENNCKICKNVKSIDQFRTCWKNRNGAICVSCEQEWASHEKVGPLAKECGHCKKILPYDQFPIDNREMSGRYTSCKSCCSKKNKETSNRHPNANRFKKLRERYGLSPTEYMAMSQLCGICGRNDVKLHVDHDHETGKVRSLLCHTCNAGIGMFKENIETLELAIKYLRKHKNL